MLAWLRSLEFGNLGEIYASRFEGAGIEWEDLCDLENDSESHKILEELGVHKVHTP